MATEKGALVVVALLALSVGWWWQPSRCDDTQQTVTIGSTVIHGLRTAVGHTHVHKYLGIRYAQPPTGLRRFQRSVLAELPQEVDATRYGAYCPQLPLSNTGMSEDCLFLNVFTPHLPSDRRVPVFVWLHGGGFIVGSSDLYEGDVLAAEGQIVVVTLNYRLGALGFLATGDNSSVGNYGLWDQHVALQWVHKYIGYFGGDERRITLGGMSAGAASASIHSLSPLSRDLFRSVVQLSGSASSPWARVSVDDALKAARALGQRLGCQIEGFNFSTQSLVHCIRNHSLERLVTSSAVLFPRQAALSLVDYIWAPVMDGALVTNLTTATPFFGPLLAGLVSNEGVTFSRWRVPRVSSYISDIKELLTQRAFYKQQLLPTLLKQAYPDLVQAAYPTRGEQQEVFSQPPYSRALQRLECAYLGHERPGKESVEDSELREVFGDQAFVFGTLWYLQQFHKYQASFLYYMDHQTERPGVEGMGHVGDAAFLFGFNSTIADILGFKGHVTDLDLQLARNLRRLIFNFLETGNPNSPEPLTRWPLWSPFTAKGADCLRISLRPALLSHLKAHKMALWTQELPRLLTSPSNASDGWQCPRLTSTSSGHFTFAPFSLIAVLSYLSRYFSCL